MQQIVETVTRPDGTQVILTTVRNAGESLEDWRQRHDDAADHLENN